MLQQGRGNQGGRSQGVDSDNSQAELLIGVHGLIDAVYWRELAKKPAIDVLVSTV